MERFFGSFKPELGKLDQYRDIGQLYEAIALTVHYYNTKRIHAALKMSPAAYAASLIPAALERDKVSGKVGGWHKSHAWNPIVRDFTLVGRKLEKLGFIYFKDKIIILEGERA